MVDERVLYIDTETNVVGSKPDPKKDLLKYVGIRYPNGNKRMFSSNQLDMVKNVISQYKFIVGHNFKKRIVEGREMGYDQPILERYGVKFYGKTIIDTMQILEKRGKSMMYLDLPPMPSLRWSCKKFNLAHQKGEFDFNILKKPIMSMSEIKELQEYLFGDLDSGYDLFEYLYKTFYKFKTELSSKERMTMGWLISSPGTTAYKWYTHVTGKPEIYDKNPPKVPYQGALMWVNNQIKSIDNVYVFDFSSLYPTMIVGGSLTNPVESNGWDGSGTIFEGYIKGMFLREHGLFEKKLINKFIERQEIKKLMKTLTFGTPEYSNSWFEQNGIKIAMNSFYGACFDDKTEIITTEGVKNIKDVQVGDLVYSLNRKTGYTEIKPITQSYKYKHKGKMVHLKSKSYDFLVTPNHTFYIDKYSSKNGFSNTLEEVMSGELGVIPNCRFPKNKGMKLNKRIELKHKYYLYGIYLSEGHARHCFKKNGKSNGYYVEFSQYKNINPDIYKKICDSLDYISLKYTATEKGIRVHNKEYYYELVNLFGRTVSKHIDNVIFNSGFDNLNSLFEGMYDGDGDKKSRNKFFGYHRYTTKLNSLKNDFVKLVVVLGYKVSISFDSGCWRINFRKSNGSFIKKYRNFSYEDYDDFVYCVTVDDNHTLLAGRNGKFEWVGNSGNPTFKNLYDDRICSSITGMARACITHAKKYFEERGYPVVYQHTDSLYVHDIFNNETKIKQIAKDIAEIQRKDMNIYNPQHNFEFEKHLQKMWLIPKTDGKGNVKNRNIVLNDKNEISYTGIKLVGRQCSKVAKVVFEKYIEPKLKAKGEIGYRYGEVLSWFKEIVKENPKLAMKKYKVRSLTSYSSTTSQQFQISMRYGEGEHYLIPNRYIGAGKVSKIATLEELQKSFKDKWILAVNYNGLMKDLVEFIKPEERKLIR